MKYLGNLAEQNIETNDWQKAYCYTSEQKREVILYYGFVQNCFVLKQIAICSGMTEEYSMYWVFTYDDYVNNNFNTFKETCLSIAEQEILPRIQFCIENNLPISTNLGQKSQPCSD